MREGEKGKRGEEERERRGGEERDESQRTLMLHGLIVPVPYLYPGTSRMWFEQF